MPHCAAGVDHRGGGWAAHSQDVGGVHDLAVKLMGAQGTKSMTFYPNAGPHLGGPTRGT